MTDNSFRKIVARLFLPFGYEVQVIRPATEREITTALLEWATEQPEETAQ